MFPFWTLNEGGHSFCTSRVFISFSVLRTKSSRNLVPVGVLWGYHEQRVMLVYNLLLHLLIWLAVRMPQHSCLGQRLILTFHHVDHRDRTHSRQLYILNHFTQQPQFMLICFFFLKHQQIHELRAGALNFHLLCSKSDARVGVRLVSRGSASLLHAA